MSAIGINVNVDIVHIKRQKANNVEVVFLERALSWESLILNSVEFL